MKKLKENLLQKMTAVVLTAALITGMAAGAAPVKVSALREGQTGHNHSHDGVDFSGAKVLSDVNGVLYVDGVAQTAKTYTLDYAPKYPYDAYELPGGTYYLADDVELNAHLRIDDADPVRLCLNGNSLKMKQRCDKGSSYLILMGYSDGGEGCLHLYDAPGDAGKITSNPSDPGEIGTGGVSLRGKSSFYMHGGQITGCNVRYSAAAVTVFRNTTFVMSGGSITGNNSECGAVDVWKDGTFKVGGKVNISGNTNTYEEKGGADVYLRDGAKITVDGLLPGSDIGVTTVEKPTAEYTQDVTWRNSADYIQYFHSDDEDCRIVIGWDNAVGLALKETATPAASPGAGTYTENQQVTLTTETDGAEIYYTVDGTVPGKENGTKYTGPIEVTGTEGQRVNKTIKAIAIKEGMLDSQVLEAEYTIALPHTHSEDETVFDTALASQAPASGSYYMTEGKSDLAIGSNVSLCLNGQKATRLNVATGAVLDLYGCNEGTVEGGISCQGTLNLHSGIIDEIELYDSGALSFAGAPKATKIFVKNSGTMLPRIDARNYIGDSVITLDLASLTGVEDHIAVCNVTDSNADKFILGNEDYYLERNGDNLIVRYNGPAVHTHSYGSEWKSDSENHWHECSCEAKTEEAAHSFGAWTVTKEATADEEGTKERSCSVCQYKQTGVIPKTENKTPATPQATEAPSTPEVQATEAPPTPEVQASEAPSTPAVQASEAPSVAEQVKNELSLNAKLKVSQTGSKIKIVWGKVSGADGYDVYVQYCGKKFTKKSITAVKSSKKTKITVKKINEKAINIKKEYRIYVLAYKLVDGGKISLGKTITAHLVGRKNAKYTNVKAIKIKKNSYRLKKGKTARIKARTVLVSPGKKQLSNAHAREFRYVSTDKKVAAVSKKGEIKAVRKGTCNIYVYARNGYARKIKVTVK